MTRRLFAILFSLLCACEGAAADPAIEEKSWPRFNELCKTAGDSIVERVADVDGYVLYVPDAWAPLFASQTSPEYDQYLQRVEFEAPGLFQDNTIRGNLHKPTRGDAEGHWPPRTPWPHYGFVELVHKGVTTRYEFNPKRGSKPPAIAQPSGPTARYAVYIEDVTVPSDRDLRVAAGQLRVVDRVSGRTLGVQRSVLKGFTWASLSQPVYPWNSKYECPENSRDIVYFIQQVLIPAAQ